MFMRALRGFEKARGAEHTSTLETIHNLGNLYKSQGKMAEAEEMYLRALRGKEKVWGSEHTSTLDTVNNLGLLYKDQGKMAEAEAMFLRALRGKDKAWGGEHTSTLNTVHNLGILYLDQGKMAEAEAMFLRALRGKEKAWGAEHTFTLQAAGSLLLHYKTEAFMHYTRTNAEKLRVPRPFRTHAPDGLSFILGRLQRLHAYCEHLLQHRMSVIGRILMWTGDLEHAIAAFQFYRSSQSGPSCDNCEKALGAGDSHLVCKSCPDVDLCEPCFRISTSGIDQDDGAFLACATHDFLHVPRATDAFYRELMVDNSTARRWISELLESTHKSEMREIRSEGNV
jgi:hypothetical protein